MFFFDALRKAAGGFVLQGAPQHVPWRGGIRL